MKELIDRYIDKSIRYYYSIILPWSEILLAASIAVLHCSRMSPICIDSVVPPSGDEAVELVDSVE